MSHLKALFSGSLHSKTMWFAVVLAILGVLEQSSGLIRAWVGEANFGLVMFVIAILAALLRVLTTLPLADKN